MHYRAHPAWRTQWLSLGFLLILLPIYLVVLLRLGFVDVNAIPYLAMWLVGILLIGVSIVMIYRRYSWRYTVDDEHIESRYGLIARDIKSIRIEDLRNINVRQSMWQRIFGIGEIEFSSAAGGGVEVVFSHIARPMELKQQVQALQDKHAARQSGD